MSVSNTTNMAGSVGSAAANATIVAISPPASMIQVQVSSATTGASFRYAVNGEALDATINSSALANSLPLPIFCPAGISSLTLYANGGISDETYLIARIARSGPGT